MCALTFVGYQECRPHVACRARRRCQLLHGWRAKAFKMASPYEQLCINGYCIADALNKHGIITDALEVLRSWFDEATQQQKGAAASSAEDVAGSGRGYFSLPAKEMLEVTDSWDGRSVRADLRLAVKTVSAEAAANSTGSTAQHGGALASHGATRHVATYINVLFLCLQGADMLKAHADMMNCLSTRHVEAPCQHRMLCWLINLCCLCRPTTRYDKLPSAP